MCLRKRQLFNYTVLMLEEEVGETSIVKAATN